MHLVKSQHSLEVCYELGVSGCVWILGSRLVQGALIQTLEISELYLSYSAALLHALAASKTTIGFWEASRCHIRVFLNMYLVTSSLALPRSLPLDASVCHRAMLY